jgi:hypothetical protein
LQFIKNAIFPFSKAHKKIIMFSTREQSAAGHRAAREPTDRADAFAADANRRLHAPVPLKPQRSLPTITEDHIVHRSDVEELARERHWSLTHSRNAQARHVLANPPGHYV